jgi:arginyl-tRNA synthetase
MLKQRILEDLKKAVEELGYNADDIVCSIPKNPGFGDYTSNIALQLAKQKPELGKQNPHEIATQILEKFGKPDYLEKAEVAGGGFINFFIKPEFLMHSLKKVCDYASLVNPKMDLEGKETKKILVEFAHPNTHKQFHIGHLRNIILGESICRLLETTGHEVFRANYQGDIGLHVAKAIWGIEKLKGRSNITDKSPLNDRIKFLGESYTKGAIAYESIESAKEEIQKINKELYAQDPKWLKLWEKTRTWSLEYFDTIYKRLGTHFHQLFFESQVQQKGEELVRNNIGTIFQRDQGAIIFKGEDFGLHNRVFITSEGNPTYEGKEMGLAEAEYEALKFDRAIHIVANEQEGYFKVVFKAIEQLHPQLKDKEFHLSYGFVDLKEGKMSSRTGQVVTFDFLYDQVKKRVENIMDKSKTATLNEVKGITSGIYPSASPQDDKAPMTEQEKAQIIDIVSIGAIKFGMLKFAPTTNIAFDLESSVALDGDSGPYLQYTYARAKSVLRTAQYNYIPTTIPETLEIEERQLLQRIEHFQSFIEDAASDLHPNIIASYLLEFARLFNLFYQKHPIIKGDKSELRLALTCAVAVVLKQGLYLLGIEAPERM